MLVPIQNIYIGCVSIFLNTIDMFFSVHFFVIRQRNEPKKNLLKNGYIT